MQSQVSDWLPERIALLTKHGKAAQIAPVLLPLGIEIVTTEAFDTDRLGTFSGEVERTLSPLACAREKARLACASTGLEAGLGSEGSFGGGPLPGLMNWNSELLVLHDARRQRDIVATASGPVTLHSFRGDEMNGIHTCLSGAPAGQAWILKVAGQIFKGLADQQALLEVLAAVGVYPEHGRLGVPVEVMPDLRAMHAPQRQKYIIKAAQQLAERLQTRCPQCSAPDFWWRERVGGLPCRDCGAPTDLTKAHIRQCLHCQYQQTEPTGESEADPSGCHSCNP